MHLQLSSPRMARALVFQLTGAPVLGASINAVRQTNSAWAGRNQWFLRYYGMTPDGVDLVLELPSSARDLSIRITDQSDGLPDLAGVTYLPRSADMAPFPDCAGVHAVSGDNIGQQDLRSAMTVTSSRQGPGEGDFAAYMPES